MTPIPIANFHVNMRYHVGMYIRSGAKNSENQWCAIVREVRPSGRQDHTGQPIIRLIVSHMLCYRPSDMECWPCGQTLVRAHPADTCLTLDGYLALRQRWRGDTDP